MQIESTKEFLLYAGLIFAYIRFALLFAASIWPKMSKYLVFAHCMLNLCLDMAGIEKLF